MARFENAAGNPLLSAAFSLQCKARQGFLLGGLLLAVSLVASPSIVHAQSSLIVRDSFEYSSGSIAGDNGGYGWENQAWTTSSSSNPDTVTAGGLTFSANSRTLVTSGNKLTTVGSDVGAYRNPPTDFGAYGGDNNQEIWIGFLVSNTTGNLSSSYAGLSLLQNGTEQFFIGAPNGANVYGFQNDSVVGYANDPQTDANNTTVNTTTHFLVTHLSFSASGSTEATLYLDPTPGVTTFDENGFTVPDVAPAADYTYTTSFQFSQMRFQSGSDAHPFNFDELRMGNTYLDVAPSAALPEPDTALLLAISAVFVSATGRRGRRSWRRCCWRRSPTSRGR